MEDTVTDYRPCSELIGPLLPLTSSNSVFYNSLSLHLLMPTQEEQKERVSNMTGKTPPHIDTSIKQELKEHPLSPK